MGDANVTVETLLAYLDRMDMGYRTHRDDSLIQTGARGDHGMYDFLIHLVGEPQRLLMIRCFIPVVVPEAERVRMAEVVARANLGLAIGCFELDMGEGLLMFRAALPIRDGYLTFEQFETLFACCMVAPDHYLPAFLRLLYGDDISPAEAIAEVEMGD